MTVSSFTISSAERQSRQPAESVAAFSLGLFPEAPAGTHDVELQFEVTNLHVAPGRNLVWRLPIRVEITK